MGEGMWVQIFSSGKFEDFPNNYFVDTYVFEEALYIDKHWFLLSESPSYS